MLSCTCSQSLNAYRARALNPGPIKEKPLVVEPNARLSRPQNPKLATHNPEPPKASSFRAPCLELQRCRSASRSTWTPHASPDRRDCQAKTFALCGFIRLSVRLELGLNRTPTRYRFRLGYCKHFCLLLGDLQNPGLPLLLRAFEGVGWWVYAVHF